MHGWSKVFAGAIGISVLASAAAQGAEDGKVAFAQREDTMKKMGRALYTTIGRVARGKAEPGPDTVAAAETVVSLAGSIADLFPPGSAIGESRVQPEIFDAEPRVEQLVTGVRAAAAKLVPAAESGDKAAIATAFETANDACEACHREFRKPE